MPDTLGRITVPSVVNSGLTFPFTTRYPHGVAVEWPVITHRFGSLDAKQEQRFVVGVGPRRFRFQHNALDWTARNQLRDFWESMQGPWKAFTYNFFNADGSGGSALVCFEVTPISFTLLRTAAEVGLTFIEVVDPSAAPSYSIASACLRFPSTALSSALLAQTQKVIPLIRIRVREGAVPDIFLSDRRVTVGGQLYLPRITDIGDAKSGALLVQDVKGTADTFQCVFGNGDGAMSNLASDTDLKFAQLDFSVFHVNSQILLNLWSGVIQDFQDDGSAEFPVSCSDGFFQIMNQYPARQLDRQCWKDYDDGNHCPWSAQGASSSAVIAAGGDPASCDFYFDSVNGCKVHGMTKFFGGVPAQPQGVVIPDPSNGFFSRNTVTATSIVSDSMWGQPLAEIWCNSGGNPLFAFMAAAMIAAYRDEAQYADALGVLGAGPIGGFAPSSIAQNGDGYRFIVAPTMDGQLWQGFKVAGNLNITQYQAGYGLRNIVGTDPVNPTTDSFSLSSTNLLGQSVWGPQRAAGVAACEIRVPKPSQIVPSTPEQHSMQVPLDYGLWGWTWNSSGTRTAVRGLVNPFWVAVNMLLRARGLYGDPATNTGPSSAAQLASFVLPSLNAGDGTGTAEIAALSVPAILGSGSETQFEFQGVIQQQKPFRDWLVEVLFTGLGYFVWEFGKLKLGIRANASVVDAYTLGNTLFQSLTLRPIAAQFEGAILSFADVAYQYQANTARYVDKSHAAYFGRSGSPLLTQLHSVGCARLSQALRLTATRVREETGGVKPTEWRDARRASWGTTLLGLANEAGQVVSQTSPKIPGIHGTCNVSGTTVTRASGDVWDESLLNKDALIAGTQVFITAVTASGGVVSSITVSPAPGDGSGKAFRAITMAFRIERWTLLKDWSVRLEGQTVTESMYDLDQGPKPADVPPGPLPQKYVPIPLGPAWAPYQVQAASNDALFPNEWTFESDQEYGETSNGYLTARLLVTGKLPVTQPSAAITGVPSVGSVSQSSTGGSLPADQTILVSLCALDASGVPSAPSRILIIGTSGTGTDEFTLSDIAWPAVAGMTGWALFAGIQDELICAQATGSLTPTGGGTTYTPASITFGAALQRSTWALPSPYVSKIRIKAKQQINGGVAGVKATNVTTGFVFASDLVDVGGTFDPSGRKLSIIGRPNAPTPYASFQITSFDRTNGKMGVTPDPVGIVHIGDALVIRNLCDASNADPFTSISDAGYKNQTNGYSGLIPDSLAGTMIRAVAGLGRGLPPRKILTNTDTSITWDGPLPMDATSVWITERATWESSADVSAAGNGDPSVPITVTVSTDNYREQPMLIAGVTVDVYGNESPDGEGPIREDWIFGAQGTRIVTATGDMLNTDGTVLFDTSAIVGTTTTLGAAITTTTSPTVLTLIAGAGTVNGTYLQIGSEVVYVQSGGGTASPTVERGQLGTTAATHLNGATVNIPGCLAFTLLAIADAPNRDLTLHKISTDLNFVKTLPNGTDTLPGGGAQIILPDTSPDKGTAVLKAPGV